jgi:predicted anti-sigma-YlaC factor YlaD
MTELNCESVRLAAMAITDGEKPELLPPQIEAHLSECANCRQEIEQLTLFAGLLDLQKCQELTVEIWPGIEQQIHDMETASKKQATWQFFLIFGLLLFGYRAIELLPGYSFGLWFNIVPALLIISVFIYLRENPFKINPSLTLEGEYYNERS